MISIPEYVKFKPEAPKFLKTFPDISKDECISVARQFNFPNITGDDVNYDAQLCLRFCRQYKITPRDIESSMVYRDMVNRLPRTIDELLLWQGVESDLRHSNYINEVKIAEQNLFEVERGLVRSMGVNIPEAVSSLDQYLEWIWIEYKDSDKYYHGGDLNYQDFIDRNKIAFFKKHNYIVSSAYTNFSLNSFWNKLCPVDDIETMKYRTYLFEFITSGCGKDVEDPLFEPDDLLTHTTTIKSALNIITTGHILTGPNLGGVSFSRNSISQTFKGNFNGVSFIFPYKILRDTGLAIPYDENLREHEKEIRNMFPIPISLCLGIVPATAELFSEVLAKGYGGDVSYTGQRIDEWRGRYERSGGIFKEGEQNALSNTYHRLQTYGKPMQT